MLDVGELRSALVARNASWSAAETKLSGLTPRHKRALAGAREMSLEQALQQASSGLTSPHPSTAMPPTKIDWRDRNGANWVTPVRDQDLCRSCVAFAVCAVMESSIRILKQTPQLDITLAPGPLFFCDHQAGCAEGRFATDIMSVARRGVGLEADAPYSAADETCHRIAPAIKVTQIRQMTGDARDRKFFIADEGPVYAEMRLFDDFLSYERGVYRHLAGEDEGLHAVVVVGYDDDNGCWLVKNSWGVDVQEAGFFRIGYGECEIDTRPFIALDVQEVSDPVA